MTILTSKQVTAKIQSLSGKLAGMQDAVQSILVAVAYQVANGNIEHVSMLLNALPYGVRAEKVKAWMLANLPIQVNPKKEARSETPFTRKAKWKNPHGVGDAANKEFALSLQNVYWYDKPAKKDVSDSADNAGEKSAATKLVASLTAAKGKIEKMPVSTDISEALAALDKAIHALSRATAQANTASPKAAESAEVVPMLQKPRKVRKSKVAVQPSAVSEETRKAA